MGKSQTTGTTGKNEPPKKPDATQKLTGGVEKGKKHSQKKSNEIDDIFNLASTSQDGSAPANEDLKAVAEEIKKARELKLAVSPQGISSVSKCMYPCLHARLHALLVQYGSMGLWEFNTIHRSIIYQYAFKGQASTGSLACSISAYKLIYELCTVGK